MDGRSVLLVSEHREDRVDGVEPVAWCWFFLAGVSPENVNVVIHSVGTVAFPLGAIATILSYRMIRSLFRYLSLILGALSLASTIIIFVGWRVVCGTCGYQQGLSQAALGLGGWESMIIYPLLIWLIGFGNYLMTARDL